MSIDVSNWVHFREVTRAQLTAARGNPPTGLHPKDFIFVSDEGIFYYGGKVYYQALFDGINSDINDINTQLAGYKFHSCTQHQYEELMPEANTVYFIIEDEV